jgi:hypothetical protein
MQYFEKVAAHIEMFIILVLVSATLKFLTEINTGKIMHKWYFLVTYSSIIRKQLITTVFLIERFSSMNMYFGRSYVTITICLLTLC